jgi:HPr kinase/phosphorylase
MSAMTGITPSATGMNIHASCVSWLERGLLLCGPSGSGKSDLALRLIEEGAVLVADDLVHLVHDAGCLTAEPVALAGHLEIRGLGIFCPPFLRRTALDLVVQLAAAETIERLPEKTTTEFCGICLPIAHIDPRWPSAVARLRARLVWPQATTEA